MATSNVESILDEVIEATWTHLRVLGFQRRGTVFRLMDRGNCGIVSFQRSAKSSQERLLFTVNVGIVCGQLLSEPKTLKIASIADAHLHERIGAFITGHPDMWWEIMGSADVNVLEQEVCGLIVDKVVPFIKMYLDTDNMVNLWESGKSPGLTDRQRMELLSELRLKGSQR